MSRGTRNHNPGNIRRSAVTYKGERQPSRDAEFKEFVSMAYGFRALFVLLYTYIKRYGADTAAEIIARYAPPSENNTSAYVSFVARRAGIQPHAAIDPADKAVMTAFATAVARIENGAEPSASDVEAGWRMFVEDYCVS